MNTTSEQILPENSDQIVEISFEDVFRFVRKYFWRAVLVGFVSAIAGFMFSYTMTRYYSSSMVVLPEYENNKMNLGMRSLVSSALGMGNMNASEALRPEIYPEVLSTVVFAQNLLLLPVVDISGKKYASYKEYLESTKEEPGILSKLFSGLGTKSENPMPKIEHSDILMLSREELLLNNRALGSVDAVYDHKTGSIRITSTTKDPVVSAFIADRASKYIIDFVQEYRTQKSSDHIAALAKNVVTSKARYQKAEYAYQSFRDANRNPFLNVARIEEQRLLSELDIARSIYNSITEEHEKAKLLLGENKQILVTLEPAQVPTKTSKPRRVYIAFYGAVLGLFLFLLYVLLYKEKLHKKVLSDN